MCTVEQRYSVDAPGRHALSCRKSTGCHHRHGELNESVLRSLVAARVPSHLEPTGLLRSDGRRPDSATLVPWKHGKTLLWDAICPDTHASSYRSLATHAAGEVAKKTEAEKEEKHHDLLHSHDFTPVTMETSGVLGPKTMSFIRKVGKRLQS